MINEYAGDCLITFFNQMVYLTTQPTPFEVKLEDTPNTGRAFILDGSDFQSVGSQWSSTLSTQGGFLWFIESEDPSSMLLIYNRVLYWIHWNICPSCYEWSLLQLLGPYPDIGTEFMGFNYRQWLTGHQKTTFTSPGVAFEPGYD